MPPVTSLTTDPIASSPYKEGSNSVWTVSIALAVVGVFLSAISFFELIHLNDPYSSFDETMKAFGGQLGAGVGLVGLGFLLHAPRWVSNYLTARKEAALVERSQTGVVQASRVNLLSNE